MPSKKVCFLSYEGFQTSFDNYKTDSKGKGSMAEMPTPLHTQTTTNDKLQMVIRGQLPQRGVQKLQ